MGPLNDIAMEKLVREMPDDYEIAGLFLLCETITPEVIMFVTRLLCCFITCKFWLLS